MSRDAELRGLAFLRGSLYRLLPAATLAYIAFSSFANTQMTLTRSLACVAIAFVSMSLLSPRTLPRARPDLQAVALALLVIFVLNLLRVIVFRPFALDSVSMIPSIIGMLGCWFLGTATAAAAPRARPLLVFFALALPLGGVALLVNAFLHGVLPQTNYWQFVPQAAVGEGVRIPFALSEDVLSLLVFFIAVTPVSLMVRAAWARWAVLPAVGAALVLIVLNGSMTFVVAALAGCAATTFLGRRSLRREERRRAVLPFVSALLVGLGGAAGILVAHPEYAAPVVASIGNKNVMEGKSVLDGRDEFWAEAVNHVDESPLVGHPLDEPTTEETRYPYSNPHNDFLLVALKFGVPAALLLIYGVLGVAWDLARAMRRPADDEVRIAAAVAFAAWTALWLPPLYSGWLSSAFFSNLALAGIAGLGYTVVRLHAPAPAPQPARRREAPPFFA